MRIHHEPLSVFKQKQSAIMTIVLLEYYYSVAVVLNLDIDFIVESKNELKELLKVELDAGVMLSSLH